MKISSSNCLPVAAAVVVGSVYCDHHHNSCGAVTTLTALVRCGALALCPWGTGYSRRKLEVERSN